MGGFEGKEERNTEFFTTSVSQSCWSKQSAEDEGFDPP